MKFQLIKTDSDSEGKHRLEMCAIHDMQHYAPKGIQVGETFEHSIEWPNHKDGLGATEQDYIKYGSSTATGIFKRIA